MKLSLYSKLYPHRDGNDSAVLFSTKRASAVLVPRDLIKDIERDGLSEEEKQTLAELGFLVRNHQEEKRAMLEFIRDLNLRIKAHIFTVVLNLDCNLRCRYCFEGRRKGKFYLSDETADRFVDFVKKRDYTNKDEIKITFYGGEPLLSTEHIARISEKILSFCESRELRYSFFLVTNGTLLTPPTVNRLVRLGLKGAKVTLDGPEHIHNAFRPFQSGTGSFEVIVRNLVEVSGAIQVQIGGNYTKENYPEFPGLLDYLADRGLTPARIGTVSFSPVVNERSEFGLPDFHDGCESINEPWLVDAVVSLRREVLKRGYRAQKVVPSPCIVDLRDSIIMNFDGALYKCPGLIGRSEYRVGNIENGMTDYGGSHALEAWKNEECLSCSYLPLCFGGCRYMKLIQDGAISGINCRKEYFDRILDELVYQDVFYNL